MRIAFSGAHFTGKTSLIEALSKKFKSYEVFEEPYYVMEEDGYEFSDPPSVDDFEEQLNCSVQLISESSDKAFFDRCPIDFLSYAQVTAEKIGGEIDSDEWASRIDEAMSYLDLIVYVPVESGVKAPRSEDLELRTSVDEHLRSLLVEDSSGFCKNVRVLEVSGSIEERVEMVEEVLRS